ncbi:protein STRUBBELIG-RECEPTOR FAMILY 7-like isoform X2 [Lolium rigidum]|uniref:protein STRUBBELIG-RECEPTOR FAMILY 7-like isoform X2 n=1 Tax=Lolium rigidum TaxID=89674 RepID=UPI001F5E1E34|nr:protein STRUBBELIG-RECEPTOR FAMILY 7-like isoform X2 [Lolium rigidum]XP_047063086.1 protein STRUBBELIG-RECEPTOR FAMILY 7-like isoform X2 [Lolium rigidum]
MTIAAMERGRRSRGAAAIGAALLLFLAAASLGAHANTDSNDVTALGVFYTTMNSPPQLKNWVSQNGDPCGQSWNGITCSGSRVTEINLSGMNLNGTLGYNMNLLTALVQLDMSNNNLGGSDIPYNLPPNLEKLNLAGNHFTGTTPYSISQMSSLKELNLGHNQISTISDMFNQMTNLTTMDISFNTFSGNIPQSFNSLTSLKTLYMQNNQFSGTIDVLSNLPLTDLNVANNQFTGWVPDKLKKINNLQTTGNSFSNGPAPPPPPGTTPTPTPQRTAPPSRNASNGSSDSGSQHSKLQGGAIAGIVICLLVVGAMVTFFVIKRKSWKFSVRRDPEQNEPLSPLASGFKQIKSIKIISTTGKDQFQKTVSMSLKPPTKIDLHKSFDDNDLTSKSITRKISLSSIRIPAYTVADLQIATGSFSPDNFISEGSFGRVFKAQFDDKKVLAVKKINFSAFPSYPSDLFIELVANISRLNHPNLAELVGYCSEHGQCLLAYEFYRNGSLYDLLNLVGDQSKPLSWNSRVKIALGSARALEYLHETCSPSVIHKNFKSSNILLDIELNPHLSDSGYADLIPNQEFQESEENLGYRAPEVTMCGQYSLKSDVYSFGVVMLELLTGRKPFDRTRSRSEQSLVRWAAPQLHDIDALDQMVDPALQGLYPSKSLSRFADAIALCVQAEPEFRPPMSEVVQSLVRLVQRANMTRMSSSCESYTGRHGESAAFDLRHPLNSSSKPPGHANPFRIRSYTQSALTNDSADQEIVIALGSNVGDRVSTFDRALRLMRSSGIKITRHACLYETAPAYVTDQPRFLNSAVRGTTKLGPHELLRRLKEIEKDIGRTAGIRYGPRPIDLDILLYGDSRIKTESLIVPHERIHERPFVLAPLVDLLGSSAEDGMEKRWHSLSKCSGGFFDLWNKLGGESIVGTEGIKRVMSVGNTLLDWRERTLVMGVLNLTPDSFSDGGKFQEVEAAISQARLLLSEGADIIDIGAQSTRPFARRLSAEEELERLVPVLDAITKLPEMEGKLLSVDTFYAQVAAEAVKRGATMINDVSGGQLDPDILQVVAELGVPYVTMHMRGDPSTMQNEQNLQYDDVCKEVASELYARLRAAELSGIPLWRIVLDPGIGFSKKSTQNIEVITGLESIREEMGKMSLGASHVPILLGPSRKSFLGQICNRADPSERDAATASAVTVAILNGANIVRVHNVRYSVDAAKVSDASLKYRRK